jgi:murein DD-endopeptidase MepM/ murein hydrolase activator NlpD
MTRTMRHLLILLAAACASTGADSEATVELSADARLARETIIRDVAAQRGLRNGLLLAGIAEAEVHLAHCWSEATWACPGPWSAECNGPVVAGSADGRCEDRLGGLGLYQFDRGGHDDTLAAHGHEILGVSGSTEEAVEFVANMVINSIYTPASLTDRASAIAWLDQVTIDGPSYDAWLKTVVHYYNGCAPGACGVYAQRRQKYDTALRTVLAERGAAFWTGATTAGGRPWSMPLASHTWKIEDNIVNPYVPGWSSCFGRPMNEIVHAGEDWANAAGTQVRAIGEGTVIYAQYAGYPGSVVVIRHDLTPGEQAALGAGTSTIYSQYGHLANLQVGAGAHVATGQHIGDVLDQGSNSHLHWEVRTAEVPQLCAYSIPGPGYTNAGTSARNWGYLDPAGSVTALAAATPATCDNNVPVDGTACAAQGEPVEYVCKRPGLPSHQQWDARPCGLGERCTGIGCQNPCAGNASITSCNANAPACAWYACVDRCYPTGTDVAAVCGW